MIFNWAYQAVQSFPIPPRSLICLDQRVLRLPSKLLFLFFAYNYDHFSCRTFPTGQRLFVHENVLNLITYDQFHQCRVCFVPLYRADPKRPSLDIFAILSRAPNKCPLCPSWCPLDAIMRFQQHLTALLQLLLHINIRWINRNPSSSEVDFTLVNPADPTNPYPDSLVWPVFNPSAPIPNPKSGFLFLELAGARPSNSYVCSANIG